MPGGRPAVDRAAASVDSAVPQVWVSTAVGAIAIPGWAHRQSEGGVPRAQVEGVVCASARLHPTPPCAGLGEPGQPEQRAMGDRCDAYRL